MPKFQIYMNIFSLYRIGSARWSITKSAVQKNNKRISSKKNKINQPMNGIENKNFY